MGVLPMLRISHFQLSVAEANDRSLVDIATGLRSVFLFGCGSRSGSSFSSSARGRSSFSALVMRAFFCRTVGFSARRRSLFGRGLLAFTLRHGEIHGHLLVRTHLDLTGLVHVLALHMDRVGEILVRLECGRNELA